MADMPPQTSAAYIEIMSPGDDNQVDWTAATTPQGERLHPGVSQPPKQGTVPLTKRNVLETLLGTNDLSAMDPGGGDPYNATGRHFRR